MYHLNEKVFIAWGSNRELALKLAENLKKLGIAPTVGGHAETRDEAEEHVGNRVINQMRSSSRAIILAQGKKEIDGSYSFRPNLMFEWGYLLARLSRGSILVALIETPREAVATDLQGTFSELVPAERDTIPKRAAWIADKFKKSLLPDRYYPFETIFDWSKTRTFLENQINGEVAPNPLILSNQLLSSFIPALYADELGFISGIIRSIGQVSSNSDNPRFVLARGILEYCRGIEREERGEKFSYSDIKRAFGNCANHPDPYVSAIARNYMGKCLAKEAFKPDFDTRKMELLNHALDHFKAAERDFDKSLSLEQSRTLWFSFTFRHISRTYFNIGNIALAEDYAERSLQCREKNLLYMRTSFNNTAKLALEAEYYLAVIDYVLITKDKKFGPFVELERKIGDGEIPPGRLWQMVTRNAAGLS